MADINKVISHIFQVEGGFVNLKADKGGPTSMGITQKTLEGYRGRKVTVDEVKNLTKYEATLIYKKNYWDKLKLDQVNSQSVADMLMDFAVNSGVSKAAKVVQGLVGVSQDGIIGPKTIEAINKENPKDLFQKLWDYRNNYYESIVRNNPSQKVFLKGWKNRLNRIEFTS